MFTEFKIYSPEDNSKYITLQRTGWIEQYDDNGKFLGDEFTVKILEKDRETELFIPAEAPLTTIQIGNEIYGFKIDY